MASSPFVPFLTVFKDDHLVDSFCLHGLDSFVLGRHTNCDVLLAHPSISRHHLRIRLLLASRELLVTDLDSVHGTWINGTQVPPLTPVPAKEGDTFKLGASSRTYKVQWLPQPQTTSNEEHSDVDLPLESVVESANPNALLIQRGCSTKENDSCTASHRIENKSPRILQELVVAGGSAHGTKTFNANMSLQISQQKRGGPSLPPRPPPPPPPPPPARRTPLADLQNSMLPTVEKRIPAAKKANCTDSVALQAATAAGGQSIHSSKQETGEPILASTILLRRCNSAPPVPLLTSVPLVQDFPLEQRNSSAQLTPHFPERDIQKSVPSAPPPTLHIAPSAHQSLTVQTPTKTMEEKRSRTVKSSENAQHVSDRIEMDKATETLTLNNRPKQFAAEGSCHLGSLLDKTVDEECASDKENMDSAVEPYKMSVAIPKAHADGSEGRSSGSRDVSRRPFQPLFLTSNGTYRSASPSISYVSPDKEDYDLAMRQRRRSSVAQNLDRMLKTLKGMARSEPRREWHIVVDISCLMDSDSFNCLKSLEGIREVRVIIPNIVIRELDCLKRRNKSRNRASRVLKWIESCMEKLPSWIHVQNSSESLPVGVTPPASPHHCHSPSSNYSEKFCDTMSPTDGDHVLNCAMVFNATVFDGQVALITNDTALKIKALAEGLVCESAATFCSSLLSPYRERFLWSGSIAHGPNWVEKACDSTTNSPRAEVTKKPLIPAARAIVSRKHHAVESLKNHCKQAQGLKAILN